LLSLLGVTVVISGGSLASLSGMAENIVAHPVSYVLAFVGAILWAVYCVVTNKYANGQNAAALFFALTAVCLWIKWLLGGAESFTISLHSAFYIAMAGAAMGFGYAAWNIGMIRGDINLLATLSYFTPILSALFASLILSSLLPPTFWLGVCAVTAGAIICWLSTKPKRVSKAAE
ncbi:MAG: aromatic amino acid DMT transporter YddG, partial [Enterobacterales bacterium]|nr:aromatic amino acid DMT transporter YddG [Enterobacterales bacterium]